MTTYDRDKEEFTTMLKVSLCLPVYVRGSLDAVDARCDAIKAVKGNLPTMIESIVVSGEDWPISPEVTLGLAESIEVDYD